MLYTPDLNTILKHRYQLVQSLPSGNFTHNYLVKDQKNNHHYVLKLLSLREAKEWKNIELLKREAGILKHLNHPAIPAYVDFFHEKTSDNSYYCLVQSQVEGKTLAEWVKQGRHFSEPETLNIALALTDILEYLHQLSPPIIHRDIKPANVLLDEQGKVSLIDFGAVRDKILHDEDKTLGIGDGSTIIGTYGYMPYEQFKGKAIPASDVYSLGATLAYLLSHTDPADMKSVDMQLCFEPYINVSPALVQVLKKMLQVNWKKRYLAVNPLKQHLLRIQQGKKSSRLQLPNLPHWLGHAILSISVILALYFFFEHEEELPPWIPMVKFYSMQRIFYSMILNIMRQLNPSP